MGADEQDQLQADSFQKVFSPTVIEKLDYGWRIVETSEGQLLLVPPPVYGDPPR